MGNYSSHSHSKAPPSREVTTNYGSVVGKRIISEGDRQVDAFWGIPFAKPPLGPLRFQKPVPPEPWTTTRQCVSWAPRGIQHDMLFWRKWQEGPTSEDNLYLNVFTPVWKAPDDQPFPVMVYIHGGGFVSDSAVKYGDIGLSRLLVSKGVVVVSTQYRLGYLGFFSTGDPSTCVDNLAMFDMTAGLEWVRDNIAHFGGDPKNVTVFGQSAGGCAVDLLSISPVSRDLFHKVIPMAGYGECDWAINRNAVETCRQKLAPKIGYFDDSKEFIEAARAVDANEFATMLKLDTTSPTQMSTEIGPRYDTEFLPRPLDELRLESPAKPRLIGHCHAEGMILQLFDKRVPGEEVLQELISRLIPEDQFPEKFLELRQKTANLYRTPKQTYTKEEWKRIIGHLYTDLFLTIGAQRLAKKCLLDGRAPTYLYSFDYFNPASFGALIGLKIPYKDATHCTELAYLFERGILTDFKFNADDERVAYIFSTLFTNFAKYGDPNGKGDKSESPLGDVHWDAISESSPQCSLSVTLHPKLESTFFAGRGQHWLDVFSQRRAPSTSS